MQVQVDKKQKYLLNNILKTIAFLTINVDAGSTDDVFWETLRVFAFYIFLASYFREVLAAKIWIKWTE